MNKLAIRPFSKPVFFSLAAVATVIITVALYILSRHNYLLFHAIVEIYSIVIAGGIFVVAWNTRRISSDHGLVFLGIAYLCIAVLDFFHTFAYVGMGIFPDYDFYANQIWVVARGIESVSILLYAIVPWKKIKQTSSLFFFSIFGGVTVLSLLSIFVWKIFPEAFIAGQGQTMFKLVSEYAIIAILLWALGLLIRDKKYHDPLLLKLFVVSILLTVLSELSFTLYSDNYGVLNVVGHILKIFSFYLIYRSIIANLLQRPYNVLFRELAESEQNLKDANNTKDRFFSIISHDLKSPFNAIINFSIMLEEMGKEAPNQEIATYAQYIHTTSRHTFSLLENLLTWSRMHTGELVCKPVALDLVQTIDLVVDIKRNIAKPKGISIEWDPDSCPAGLLAHADSQMIQTVLRNLISNAIKYTHNGGRITVTADKDGDLCLICIEDNGVGMPADQQEKIGRVEHRFSLPGTNKETGTGLGLILCQEFIDRNEGSMTIHSQVGKGTRVIIRLPAFQKSNP